MVEAVPTLDCREESGNAQNFTNELDTISKMNTGKRKNVQKFIKIIKTILKTTVEKTEETR
jgi:hypothetical protein